MFYPFEVKENTFEFRAIYSKIFIAGEDINCPSEIDRVRHGIVNIRGGQ